MKNNINKIIKKLVLNVKNIEKNNNIKQSKKNKLYKYESFNIKKIIEKKNISINSYITYISRCRSQFINKKHHNFKKKIKILKKIFPYFYEEINDIQKTNNTKIIKIKIKKLNKKLENIKIICKYLNRNINFTKNNFKIIKNSYIKFKEWKKELKNILEKKWYISNKNIINKIQFGEKLNNKIKKIKINHEILSYLKIDKRKLYISKRISNEKLKIKKSNIIKIEYNTYIKEINNILNNKNKLNNIKDIASLSFCLSAISGRRMIEIIKTGKFKLTNKKNQLKFYGQVKTINKKPYNIYILLYNGSFFIKKIKQLRNSIIIKNIIKKIKKKNNKYLSKNYQISNYLSNSFNKWVKYFFQDKKRTYKDSRSIYIRIAYKMWYKKDKKWKKYDEDMFFYKILGHKNITTQIYYKQFKIINFNNNILINKENNTRYNKLISIENKIKKIIKRKKAFKIYEISKKILLNNDNKLINTYILRKYGFNTILVQKYIKLISKFINQKKINGKYIINREKIIIK